MATLHHMFLSCLAIASIVIVPATAQLSANFYDSVCPQALPTIKTVVEAAVLLEPRMGASLLRLHFHDCFVNGCDGSILLDDINNTFTGEKTAGPNLNSVRGFDVIDNIKAAVNLACLENVVSCADILAVAARDSVVALGGGSYEVLLGRRDSTTASKDAANANLPSPLFDFSSLLSSFQAQDLNLQDLVVLSGGHTIGFARCLLFRDRIYNESDIDASFAETRKAQCPQSGGDNNHAPLDGSTASFDVNYYTSLVQNKGLLHSDQQLFRGDGGDSDALVTAYSQSMATFWVDFGTAMVKMGNLSPLSGSDGQVRENCRVVN